MENSMKRSEILKLMKEAASIHYGESIHDPDFEDRLMNTLLSSLEKQGMLPPRTKLEPMGLSDNAWDPE